MRHLALVLLALCCAAASLLAQAPQSIPYQAVARDAGGHLMADQAVGIRFSIHDITLDGPVIYAESHAATTNAFGLFTVNVGEGTPITGSFAAIQWANGAKFLQVELDPSGGGTFIDMGTSQMLSVPYALYAERAGNVTLNFQFYFSDRDSDGLGDKWNNYYGPYALSGYVADSTDCDDSVPYPGGVYYLYPDADGDGYGSPGFVIESCDPEVFGFVSNMDDCADGDPTLPMIYFADNDQDGWGGEVTALFCEDPGMGYTLQGGDCNDDDPEQNPDLGCGTCSQESIDWLTSNQNYFNEVASQCYLQCSGNSECFIECLTQQTPIEPACAACYFSFYDCLLQNCFEACMIGGPECVQCGMEAGCYAEFLSCSGLVDADMDGSYAGVDCDDSDPSVNPQAAETCDNLDNNCNGMIDENAGTMQYPDMDADGFGTAEGALMSCISLDGYASQDGDCDDTDPTVFPGNGCGVCSQESINFIAANFYEVIDYAGECAVTFNFDQQSFTDCITSNFPIDAECTVCIYDYLLCVQDFCGTECVFAPEMCFDCSSASGCANGLLNCLGIEDNDGDGYIAGEDCDDADPSVNPGAFELCSDGVDNDCDGMVDEEQAWYFDADGDGWGTMETEPVMSCEFIFGFVTSGGDCDDADATIFPGAPEPCDLLDNDCDGMVDEDAVFYQDADADGWGDAANVFFGCSPPDHFVAIAGDCDDTNPDIFPGAAEICADGIDQDCDGADGGFEYYLDNDGDGFGTMDVTLFACEMPEGYAAMAGDCDDADPSINPSAFEACNGLDDDCDGAIDDNAGTLWYEDNDLDGFGSYNFAFYSCEQPQGFAAVGGDCDDQDSSVYPGNGCDGCDPASAQFIAANQQVVLDAAGQCFVQNFPVTDINFFTDCLISQFPQINASCAECIYVAYMCTVNNCLGPCSGGSPDCLQCQLQSGCIGGLSSCLGLPDNDNDGWFPPSDCDDANDSVYPGASEVCDGVDNDCDGQVDFLYTLYPDIDGDGYGTFGSEIQSCEALPGYALGAGDCDDEDPSVYPGAYEACDGMDNDCDGIADNSYTLYPDADQDGWGDESQPYTGCEIPSGYVIDGGDCDDTDASINPAAYDYCGDGIDQDCNGQDAGYNWYPDSDGDGYGTDNGPVQFGCEMPVGHSPVSGDCDDDDASINPGAMELCDDIDNNCDGAVDNNAGVQYFPDADGDSYGDASQGVFSCTPLDGYVLDGNDCDDSDAMVYPGNGCGDCSDASIQFIYENLDQVLTTAGQCMYYTGGGPGELEYCLLIAYPQLEGACISCIYEAMLCAEYSCGPECVIYPTECGQCWTESGCLFTMFNCMGATDSDGDGVLDVADCDPANASVYPGAAEVCDGLDNDCDGMIDELSAWFADLDMDGWGDTNAMIMSCVPVDSHVQNAGDCDDADPSVHPGAFDVCLDGIDQDCDGADFSVVLYPDQDGDGFGQYGEGIQGCGSEAGFSNQTGDCDDTDSAVFPGAAETCNTIDDDCDGMVDEDAGTVWFLDQDGDGFGQTNYSSFSCTPIPGFSQVPGDCDDANPMVFPGNGCGTCGEPSIYFILGNIDFIFEIAGMCWEYTSTDPGAFSNCLMMSFPQLEGGCTSCIYEAMLDIESSCGYGCALFPYSCMPCIQGSGIGDSFLACIGAVDSDGDGSMDFADCAPANPAVFPGAFDGCDGVDNNCNGQIDEGSMFYQDLDGDGWGNAAASQNSCTPQPGWVTEAGDCDDADPTVYPFAYEACDGIDNDCDGMVDFLYFLYPDLDGDGYASGEGMPIESCEYMSGYSDALGDCNDSDPSIYPGAPDFCEDSIDQNCDGIAYCTEDLDGDGLGGLFEFQLGLDPWDYDSDDDGLIDGFEHPNGDYYDIDGDGLVDGLDDDDDGDGIPTAQEDLDQFLYNAYDVDGDGYPNYYDFDSDGDGIFDFEEGTGDSDGDGVPNYIDFF